MAMSKFQEVRNELSKLDAKLLKGEKVDNELYQYLLEEYYNYVDHYTSMFN